MIRRSTALLIPCTVALMLAIPVRATAQDSLAAARQLYASAEYASALSMLSGLLATNPSPQERQSIELYRVFCLFAVNSFDEANSALEAMILRDPLFRPSMDEIPRRLRPAFTEARKRLLPSVIEQKYLVAKEAFDRGDLKAASTGFTQTLIALSDPDIAEDAQQRPLSDLRVLATGFNDLTVRALAPPVEPPAPAPAPVAVVPAARLSKIYDSHDSDVSAPVTVRQDVPPYPGQIVAHRNGKLDIIIAENGAVESATMVAPIEPRYNAMVVAAAKAWQYRPATVAGVPVKFKKTIQITLTPTR